MYTKGIDVSKFQGKPDFVQVKNAGYEVVTILVDDYNSNKDDQIAAARAAGLRVQVYWYFRANDNLEHVVAQLKHYYQEGDLDPAIDIETSGNAGINSQNCHAVLSAVQANLGFQPTLYCGRGDYDALGLQDTTNPLWHAAYPYNNGTWHPADGQQPNNAARGVYGWQYTSTEHVPGVNGECDATAWYTLPLLGTGHGQSAVGTSTPPASAKPISYQPGTRTLANGAQGNDVVALQQKLGIAADGLFGAQTTTAVREYQASHGLSVDGVVGPGTWNALLNNAAAFPAWPGRVLSKGSNGADVKQMQQQLANRGWKISVDGQFGPGTDTIVRAFQQEKHLNVDGQVGPVTWAAFWTAAR